MTGASVAAWREAVELPPNSFVVIDDLNTDFISNLLPEANCDPRTGGNIFDYYIVWTFSDPLSFLL